MNKLLTAMSLTALAGVALLAPARAWADMPMHGRVSFDAGGSMVSGANDSDWSHATVNTMILPGDTLWVDQGGTSELEFSGGNFLRMADGSKSEVAAISPTLTIRGWEGSFYVQRMSRSSGDYVFVAPAATIQVDPDSQVRIDIVNQATTVTVRWGRATVRTDVGNPVVVNAGQQVWVDPGLLPSEPVAFNRNQQDGFDVWNRERAERLATGFSGVNRTAVPDQVIGVSDLSQYGDWVAVDGHTYWRPTAVTNYVPYRYGHWSNVPTVGYAWTGRYPFCYTTSRYGRWSHHSRHGWMWRYDPVWSPAWVATVRAGDYFVWTPVDFYSRPVYSTTASYFSIGGVSFGVFASSYSPVGQVYLGPRYVYGVHSDFVRTIHSPTTEINIWNINVNRPHHVRVPFQRDFDQVRVYNPRRSIRGPQSFAYGGRDSILASQRVNTLQRGLGRDSFSTVDRTGRAGTRTQATAQERTARARDVRVTQEMPSFFRASSRAPEDAAVASSRAMRASGTRDIGAGGRDVSGVRGLRSTETTPDRGGATIRPGTTVRDRTAVGTDTRDRRDTADTATPGRTARTPLTDMTPRTGTQVRGERTTTPGTATDRTATPRATTPRATAPDVQTSPRATPDVRAGRTQVPAARDGGVRSTPPTATTPDRTRAAAPAQRTTPPAQRTTPRASGPADVQAPTRTPQRPTATAPARTQTATPRTTPQATTPRATTPQATSPRTATPPSTTPRATAPRVSTPGVTPRSSVPQVTPQRNQAAPQRSAPQATPRSAPQRSAPQATAPQRSAPQVTPRSAPQQRSAPQVTAPQRSAPQATPRSAPQRSAPQATAPQRSAPQVTPRSAPQQRSAPQVAAPQQRSAPAAAPQRSAPQATPRSAPQRSAPQVAAPQQRSAPAAAQRSAPSISRPAPAPSGGRGGASAAPSRPSSPAASGGRAVRGGR